MNNKNKSLRSLRALRLILLIVLINSQTAFSLTSIKLGESSGLAGNQVTVPVTINLGESVTALQLDILHNPNIANVGFIETGDFFSNHKMSFQDVDVGMTRVVFHSDNNHSVSSGHLINIPVTFNQTVDENNRSLSLGNVIFSDRNGSQRSVSLIPHTRVTDPDMDTAYMLNDAIQVTAIAIDTDNEITQVEFFANGQKYDFTSTSPYSTTLTANRLGEVLLTTIATDTEGNRTTSQPVAIGVGFPSKYASWRERIFSTVDRDIDSLSGLFADFDKDGLSNFLEYALGLDPALSSINRLPIPKMETSINEDYLTLTYRRPNQITDVNYFIEVSDNFIDWKSGGSNTVEMSNDMVGVFNEITVRDSIPLKDKNARYMRLKVEKVESVE